MMLLQQFNQNGSLESTHTRVADFILRGLQHLILQRRGAGRGGEENKTPLDRSFSSLLINNTDRGWARLSLVSWDLVQQLQGKPGSSNPSIIFAVPSQRRSEPPFTARASLSFTAAGVHRRGEMPCAVLAADDPTPGRDSSVQPIAGSSRAGLRIQRGQTARAYGPTVGRAVLDYLCAPLPPTPSSVLP